MTKYHERFAKVVNYIEANLDEDLDVDKLCKLACLSKYHFHRQCSLFFGMSIMSLIRMLRLKRAATLVAYRDMNMLDIAIESGYESHEAFSRVFKKYFNKSPSDFRKSPDWTPWHSLYEPVMQLRNKIMNKNFSVEIVEYPETLIAVMEHRGSPNLLGRTIQKFISWRKANGLPPSKSKTFNLVYDDPKTTAPEYFRFDLGCSIDKEVDATQSGIINKIIPIGKCALIRHVGSDDALGALVDFLYSEWLQESDFELRDFPVLFERVKFFPEVPENEMITDVYLPIQ
jgi:AraC family transcriptional regulator